MTDPVRLPEHRVFLGPSVVLDGRACALLNRALNLDRVRVELRGQTPELDWALQAIKLGALAHASSVGGTSVAPQPEPRIASTEVDSVSTSLAAELLGITPRAVRRAIAEKRLPATRLDGRWRIARDDLQYYRSRAAA